MEVTEITTELNNYYFIIPLLLSSMSYLQILFLRQFTFINIMYICPFLKGFGTMDVGIDAC